MREKERSEQRDKRGKESESKRNGVSPKCPHYYIIILTRHHSDYLVFST